MEKNHSNQLPFPFVNVNAVILIDVIDRWTPLTLKIFFAMSSTMGDQEFRSPRYLVETFCDLFKADKASVIQSFEQLEADNAIIITMKGHGS